MPGTAAFAGRIAATEERLRHALLTGTGTVDLHAELAEQRAHRARVTEAAAGHVAVAAQRLASRMAALAPPSPPIPLPDRGAAPTRILAP